MIRSGSFSRAGVAILALVVLAMLSACTTRGALTEAPFIPPTPRYAAIVVDGNNGKVLHSTRADAIRFPASLTKMMTMLMLFEALDRGQISKGTLIPISGKASRQPASKLYMKEGGSITVHKALEALAVKSANDVAYATAEFLAGSEAAFARRMTAKARSFGMRSTTFRNASGLPDKHQVTTARDMAKLGLVLRKRYPQHYHYFGRRSFVFNGKRIKGHNRVLGKVRGADGIKTGYTRASGYNLVTSVRYGEKQVVGVILGENSGRSRDAHMVQLIERYLPSAGPR